ncbi:hypothetical protein ACSSS7_004289 [Eimeria intestinalis]
MSEVGRGRACERLRGDNDVVNGESAGESEGSKAPGDLGEAGFSVIGAFFPFFDFRLKLVFHLFFRVSTLSVSPITTPLAQAAGVAWTRKARRQLGEWASQSSRLLLPYKPNALTFCFKLAFAIERQGANGPLGEQTARGHCHSSWWSAGGALGASSAGCAWNTPLCSRFSKIVAGNMPRKELQSQASCELFPPVPQGRPRPLCEHRRSSGPLTAAAAAAAAAAGLPKLQCCPRCSGRLSSCSCSRTIIDAERQRVWQQQEMLQGHQTFLHEEHSMLGTHTDRLVQRKLQGTNLRPRHALSPGAPSQRGICQVNEAPLLHFYAAQQALRATAAHAPALPQQQRQHSRRYHPRELLQQQQHQQQQQQQEQQQQSMGPGNRYGGGRGSQQSPRGARLVPASEPMTGACPQGYSLTVTSCPPPQDPSYAATRAACVNPFPSRDNTLEAAVALLDKPLAEEAASPPLPARLVSRLRAEPQRGTSCRSASNSSAGSRMERQRQLPVPSSHISSSNGSLARDASDTVPSISSSHGRGKGRLLQDYLEEHKAPHLRGFHQRLSLGSQAASRVGDAGTTNTSRSHSTWPSPPRVDLSSAVGLGAPVSVPSCLLLDAGRDGSAGSAALRSHSDEPSTFSASRRALTASVSELQARLAAAEHQVTHNFVGCLRREIVLRQLQQQLNRRGHGPANRIYGYPLDAALPLPEPANMLLTLQQKLQYLKEALKRKHLFEMELRARISSLLTLNEELQAEASTLMAFHRLTDAHGQAAAEKLLLQQARQELALLTLSASCISPLRAQAEGQTCKSKELQRLLANRESEVLALKREVALCRRALASFAASFRKTPWIGALEITPTNPRPAIALQGGEKEASFPDAPESLEGETHRATGLALDVSFSESSGAAEARPSAAPLTEASPSDSEESPPASAPQPALVQTPEVSSTRLLDDSADAPLETLESGPPQTTTPRPFETSAFGMPGANLVGPLGPALAMISKGTGELSAQAEASSPRAEAPPVLAVGGSHVIGGCHPSPIGISEALPAVPAGVSAPGASAFNETANAEASLHESSQVALTEPLEACPTKPPIAHPEGRPQFIRQGPSQTCLAQLLVPAWTGASDSGETYEAFRQQPPREALIMEQSGAHGKARGVAPSAALPDPCRTLSRGSNSLANLPTLSTAEPATPTLVPASLCPREPPELGLKENFGRSVVNDEPSAETAVEKPLLAPASHVEARGTQTDSAISWMMTDIPKQSPVYPWQQTPSPFRVEGQSAAFMRRQAAVLGLQPQLVLSPQERPGRLLVPTSQSVVRGASLARKQACETGSQALVTQQQQKEQQVLMLQPFEEASLTCTAEQTGLEGPSMPTLGPGANTLLRFTVGSSKMYVPTADDSIDSAVALLSNTRINKVLFTRICQGVYLYGHLAVVMRLGPTGELRVSFEGKDYSVKDFIHSFEDEEFRYLAARRNQAGHPLPLGNDSEHLQVLAGQHQHQQHQPQQPQQQEPRQQKLQQQQASPFQAACEGAQQESMAQTNPPKEEGPISGTLTLPADLRRAARALAALARARRGRTLRGAADIPPAAAPVKTSKSRAAGPPSSVISSSGPLPPGRSKGTTSKQRPRASAAPLATASDQQGTLKKAPHAGGTKRRAVSAKARLS